MTSTNVILASVVDKDVDSRLIVQKLPGTFSNGLKLRQVQMINSHTVTRLRPESVSTVDLLFVLAISNSYLMNDAQSLACFKFLQAKMTSAPLFDISLAVSKPMPALLPVTRTILPSSLAVLLHIPPEK